MDKKETGSDGALTISGYNGDVPVTNGSYALDADTSESQFMGGFTQNIAITGVSYSGSFEHDGSNDELRSLIRDGNGMPKVLTQLTFKESERNVIFKNVIVTSHSKDVPGDDRTSVTYDWVAETVTINTK